MYNKFVKDFQDTEDLRDIPLEERDQYGVAMNNGINFYEGVQNRQDACIRINVLFLVKSKYYMDQETFDRTKVRFGEKYGSGIPDQYLSVITHAKRDRSKDEINGARKAIASVH